MKAAAIVQARMGSARFPGKVMKPIRGTPLIELLLERLRDAKEIGQIILATSQAPENSVLADYVRTLGYTVYRGSEQDVLDRYYEAAQLSHADILVRITGDCPLVDPALVDLMVTAFRSAGVEYAGNTDPQTYPDGLDIEVFSKGALATAWREARCQPEREHVTPYMRESGRFRTLNLPHSENLSAARWTVDEAADFEVIAGVFEHFHPRRNFGWQEVLQLMRIRPELFSANHHLVRNEGSSMSTGQKLWKRAKRVIPGGNMLLSKRAEMFLPELWPAYFSRTQGCKVWDLDGNEFTDMSIMGIGTNTLGYSHPEVDAAVRAAIDAGNMSTLNCAEEVYLAERLVELHPWAQMARLARSGGEADAIAVRIARAASGKDKVAICGYHGWHDWYLAANLADDRNLSGHLLPGLEPNGVPRALLGSVLPFNYNKYDELERLVNEHDIGVIMMEVSRNQGPTNNFLQKVRQLASSRGIVLIFDECTSGFRQTFGGLHKAYGVEPDMAMFGKALGNGYAITATIGRREVMEAAQTSFISSTFWTERIGPTAALKTLEVMQSTGSWEQITRTGEKIFAGWHELAEKHGLAIATSGLPALASFSFTSPRALAYKTLLTQEMLAKGYLAGTSVYVCTQHTPDVVAAYFAALDPIFRLIRECEDGREVTQVLKGPVCHAGFKRLN
ncbi:MAG TPA: aminotransferase class III-fold pyridoxal phosphate-dependent enzyme [Steroidobacteraceae bacterium]|nr:aminotransferase class III-fold pyridoxal phosphate-dependent enzyme [Steroidobacteraceae bacterium]